MQTNPQNSTPAIFAGVLAAIDRTDVYKYRNTQMYGKTSLTKEHHKI